jgi:hypothetical protein
MMIINKDTLRKELKEGVKTITFTKTDGTQRVLKCTLQEFVLPQVDATKLVTAKKQNDEALAVWDIENAGWRSFRYDSIISVV